MEWISVKNKLPKDFPGRCEHDCVFVYADDCKDGPSWLISVAQFYDGAWVILGNSGGHSCTGFYGMKSEDVTHWSFMNFPKEIDGMD